MDEELLKYRFGITLELYQSTYSFGTDADPPEYANSPCWFTVAWFQQFGYTLIPVKFNTYIVQGVTSISTIRNHLNGYYVTTKNKCVPFL